MEQINTDVEQQGGPKQPKHDHLTWRRNMTLELIAQGRMERGRPDSKGRKWYSS
jgi:hypothetical protein